MRAWSIGSGEGAMPGTMLLGEKAACSISANQFSGFLSSVTRPTLRKGVLLFGPHLGHIKDIDGRFVHLVWMYHLNADVSGWVVAFIDSILEIQYMLVWFSPGIFCAICICKPMNALV